jgi:hypothetical protein
MNEVLGPDWGKGDPSFFDGLLRGDRERFITGLIPPPGMRELYPPDWPESLARINGAADDPRRKAWFAELRSRQAQARALLQARHEERNVSLAP